MCGTNVTRGGAGQKVHDSLGLGPGGSARGQAAVITELGGSSGGHRGPHSSTVTRSLCFPLQDVLASWGVNLELSPVSGFYPP